MNMDLACPSGLQNEEEGSARELVAKPLGDELLRRQAAPRHHLLRLRRHMQSEGDWLTHLLDRQGIEPQLRQAAQRTPLDGNIDRETGIIRTMAAGEGLDGHELA